MWVKCLDYQLNIMTLSIISVWCKDEMTMTPTCGEQYVRRIIWKLKRNLNWRYFFTYRLIRYQDPELKSMQQNQRYWYREKSFLFLIFLFFLKTCWLHYPQSISTTGSSVWCCVPFTLEVNFGAGSDVTSKLTAFQLQLGRAIVVVSTVS